jgi:MFS transporter, MHS family, proline/betaine transporter
MKFSSFLIAAVCTIVQYYDYHLFGFLAAKISKHFFDNSDPVVSLLKAYFVMTIAVVAKPIGALVLGRLGDIYGRFTTVIISLSGTAAASFVISITPGHDKIGVTSALILLLARMCISGLVSSGTDGVRIYIFERIGKGKQCLGNGLITFSTQFGSFLAAVSAWFFSLDFMPEYSWRIAFLIGTVMGVIVVYFRLKHVIEEDVVDEKDPEYKHFKDQRTLSIVYKNLHLFIPCTLLAGCIGSTYQFIIIFFGTYNFEILKILDPSRMQFITSAGIIIYMIFSVIGGLCSDFFGKKIVANIASVFIIIFSSIFGYKIAHGNFSLALYFFMIVALPFITMPALAFFKESIPKAIRYRVFSLAHAIGSMCISAPTAYVSTLLYYETKSAWIPIIYFVVTILIMILSINHLSKFTKAGNSSIKIFK